MSPLVGSITSTLSARWKSYLLGSAVLFWLLGAGMLLLSRSDVLRTADCGKRPDLLCWAQANEPGGPVVLLILAAVVVIATAALLNAVAEPTLALLCGPWPENSLTRWRRGRLEKRRAALTAPGAGPDDSERRRFPALRDTVLAPTRIGNAQAAMNQRIKSAYGLDLGCTWPILLVLIPNTMHDRLASATATVLGRVQQWVLSVIAVGWVALLWTGHLPGTSRIGWTALFLVIWALVSMAAFRRIRSAAYEYFDLVESVVTVHRKLLYTELGLTAPTDSDTEPERGGEVSDYLNLDGGTEALSW